MVNEWNNLPVAVKSSKSVKSSLRINMCTGCSSEMKHEIQINQKVIEKFLRKITENHDDKDQ